MSAGTIRTTLTLPPDLLDAVDEAVRQGRARSRSELVSAALRRELAMRERAAIDEAFRAMADDAEYRAEAELIAREFAQAEWEAFQSVEQSLEDGDSAPR
jgi:Arc/MetJ-type ribon-helix-helix transcriptional regulator